MTTNELTQNRDPIETTITYDHNENMVIGWTNHDPTIRAWRRDFAEYISTNTRRINSQRTEDIAELRIPSELMQASNKLKRRRVVVSEEARQQKAERLRVARDSKSKAASVS